MSKSFFTARLTEFGTACIIGLFGTWLFYSLMPTRFWFQYTSIEAILPVHEGQPIYFRSYIDGQREAPVTWIDVLLCKSPGEENFKQIERRVNEGVVGIQAPEAGPIWLYGVTAAKEGDLCYLRSLSILKFPLRIERHAITNGKLFEVGPPLEVTDPS